MRLQLMDCRPTAAITMMCAYKVRLDNSLEGRKIIPFLAGRSSLLQCGLWRNSELADRWRRRHGGGTRTARRGGRGQLLARTRRAFHVIPPGAPPPRSVRPRSTAVGGSAAHNGRGTHVNNPLATVANTVLVSTYRRCLPPPPQPSRYILFVLLSSLSLSPFECRAFVSRIKSFRFLPLRPTSLSESQCVLPARATV